MKLVNKKGYIVCIACIVLGVSMPFLFSHVQDYYLCSIEDSRVLEISEFNDDETDVKDVLLLLASEHDELEYNGETKLSVLNIGIYAKTITEELIDEGLLPEFDVENAKVKANVSLINSKYTSSYSKEESIKYFSLFKVNAIVWRCEFYGIDDVTYSITIDDNSGKLVSMYYGEESDFNQISIDEELSDSENTYEVINKYNSFLTYYYNLEDAGLVENVDEKFVKEYSLSISTDAGYRDEVNLVFYNNIVYFNY